MYIYEILYINVLSILSFYSRRERKPMKQQLKNRITKLISRGATSVAKLWAKKCPNRELASWLGLTATWQLPLQLDQLHSESKPTRITVTYFFFPINRKAHVEPPKRQVSYIDADLRKLSHATTNTCTIHNQLTLSSSQRLIIQPAKPQPSLYGKIAQLNRAMQPWGVWNMYSMYVCA